MTPPVDHPQIVRPEEHQHPRVKQDLHAKLPDYRRRLVSRAFLLSNRDPVQLERRATVAHPALAQEEAAIVVAAQEEAVADDGRKKCCIPLSK